MLYCDWRCSQTLTDVSLVLPRAVLCNVTRRRGDRQQVIVRQRVRGSDSAVRAVRNTRVFGTETRVVADAQQTRQRNLIPNSSPPPLAIRLLRQSTYPRAATPWKIRPKIQVMYDGRLRARFDDMLGIMGPRITSSKVTVGCHFGQGEECPLIMPTQRPNRHLRATRSDRICRGN
jgi:hypothetical protein